MASGAMISSGIFVLPAYVYGLIGPSLLLAYALAGLLVLPAALCQAELSSAIPKSGGSYFFTARSLGPLWGTFAGFANWLSIATKGSFALVGMGTFLQLIYPDVTDLQVRLVAISLIVFFTLINLRGTQSSAHSGNFMVIILLFSMLAFVGFGVGGMERSHFTPFFASDLKTFFLVTSLVFISYGGLTKVASISGEVHNPKVNIPKGIMTSFFVVNLLYLLILTILIGVLFPESLQNSFTPLTDAMQALNYPWIAYLMTLGALFAFSTTANASILSASQSPLIMAEDRLLPSFFCQRTKKTQVPYVAILTTGLFMIVLVGGLNILNLVKVASAMMLILYVFTCASVLLNHSSKLASYRPTFKVRGGWVLPVLGIIVYIVFLVNLGFLPMFITLGFFIVSSLFYFFFAKGNKSSSPSALIRLVERLANKEFQTSNLDYELTQILLDRDNIVFDSFDHIIQKANILITTEIKTKPEAFDHIAQELAQHYSLRHSKILALLEERESQASTIVSQNLAVPHIVLEHEIPLNMAIIHNPEGIYFDEKHPKIEFIFCLAGNKKERTLHVQCLMAIAQIVQNKQFNLHRYKLRDAEEFRNLILSLERNRF